MRGLRVEVRNESEGRGESEGRDESERRANEDCGVKMDRRESK